MARFRDGPQCLLLTGSRVTKQEHKICPSSLDECLTNIIRGDGNFLKARQEAKKGELDEQLKEYINEWRKQRSKEEASSHYV